MKKIWNAYRLKVAARTVAGIFLILFISIIQGVPLLLAQDKSSESKAREVVAASIEAMGGDAYLNVTGVMSYGRYFAFRKGRKAFARFHDWTVYDPVKWRFQLGKGKNQNVQIFNLELGKAWSLEGKDYVEEIPEEAIQDFRRGAKKDIDLILRQRLNEEGMNLYYYGPDDVSGTGEVEAVEFLDATNDSLVVFFDTKTHLPVKTETHNTDRVGVRHKQEQEFSNWHVIQGINTALRHDVYVDGEISRQRFIEELTYNPTFPPGHFEEPVVEEDD
jgi:hypothetical protein